MNFTKHLKVLYNAFLSRSNEVHRHVIQSIILKLTDIETDLGQMLLELCISTATGAWLDEWGSWFNVTRRVSEKDKEYSERIIISIKIPKSTIAALKYNAANFLNDRWSDEQKYTEDDISVFEPWELINVMSHKGTLSGKHRFPDSDYWRRNIVEIALPEDVTAEFIEMINRVKAGGIKIIYAVEPLRFPVVQSYTEIPPVACMNISTGKSIHRMVEGVLLSVPQSRNGALSGRRTLWGIEKTVFNEYELANMFRAWDESYIFRNEGFLVPIMVPQETGVPAIYSQQAGIMSSFKLKSVKYKTQADQLTEWDKIHLQGNTQRDLYTIKPHILSRQARLSHDTSLSGAFGEAYSFTGHKDTINALVNNVFNTIPIESTRTLHTDISLPMNRWSSKYMSGRRELYSGSGVYTDIGISQMTRQFKNTIIFRNITSVDTPFRKHIPKQDGNASVLSSKAGLLSGPATEKTLLVRSTYEMSDFEHERLQPEVDRVIEFLKPQVLSTHSRLSGGNSLSGANNYRHGNRPLFGETAYGFCSSSADINRSSNEVSFYQLLLRTKTIFSTLSGGDYLSGHADKHICDTLSFDWTMRDHNEETEMQFPISRAVSQDMDLVYSSTIVSLAQSSLIINAAVKTDTAEAFHPELNLDSECNHLDYCLINWHSRTITVQDVLNRYGECTVDYLSNNSAATTLQSKVEIRIFTDHGDYYEDEGDLEIVTVMSEMTSVEAETGKIKHHVSVDNLINQYRNKTISELCNERDESILQSPAIMSIGTDSMVVIGSTVNEIQIELMKEEEY